jgi:hypothetical protein
MNFLSTVTDRANLNIQPKLSLLLRLFGYGRTFLPIVGTLYCMAILSYVFVWMVDPYDLRPWGVSVRLAGHRYPDRIVPRLFSVAARDGTDLVMLGGSATMGFMRSMLREAYPEASQPVNLSFVAQRADELEIVLARIEPSYSLKRVILTLDFTLINDITWIARALDKRYYAENWHDPVPEFDLDAIRLSWNVLRTGALDIPGWHLKNPNRPEFMETDLPVTAFPERVAKLAAAAEGSRAWVTQAPAIACDDFPSLRTVVLPFTQRMAARGVFVDLLAPPYSLAVYSDWSVNNPDGHFFSRKGKGSVFANLVSLLRCAVEMTAGIPNVRVHAFNTDLSITRDLSRYYDGSHILDYETYRHIMLRMATGDAVLTTAKWPEFETALKTAVEEFSP